MSHARTFPVNLALGHFSQTEHFILNSPMQSSLRSLRYTRTTKRSGIKQAEAQPYLPVLAFPSIPQTRRGLDEKCSTAAHATVNSAGNTLPMQVDRVVTPPRYQKHILLLDFQELLALEKQRASWVNKHHWEQTS